MRRVPVLVTGAAGFIGVHLARRLEEQGNEVRAVDVRPRPPHLTGPGIAYHRADIRERSRLEELLDGVDTAYHLASMHLEVRAAAAEFAQVNVAGVEGVVTACAGAGVRRLVHTSSVGIYGHIERPPAREDAPRRPMTPYEWTKLAGEAAAVRLAERLGVDLVVIRPAWVYGPGCPRTAKLLRALRKGHFFFIGDGSNLRHPVYIDDMIEAYRLAAAAPGGVAGRGYIIAGPRALPLRELVATASAVLGVRSPARSIPRPLGRALGLAAELAFGALGRDAPFSRRSLAFFENDNAFDTTAARRDLGFEPRVDLVEGLQRTLAGAAWATVHPDFAEAHRP